MGDLYHRANVTAATFMIFCCVSERLFWLYSPPGMSRKENVCMTAKMKNDYFKIGSLTLFV